MYVCMYVCMYVRMYVMYVCNVCKPWLEESSLVVPSACMERWRWPTRLVTGSGGTRSPGQRAGYELRGLPLRLQTCRESSLLSGTARPVHHTAPVQWWLLAVQGVHVEGGNQEDGRGDMVKFLARVPSWLGLSAKPGSRLHDG